ncbi:pyruvate ferredoxin oxidoreductase [Eggerthella sp. AM16-19]|uniref:transketolase C-terminal domain-containing protein n=1 Tax=Eggerthella sp. AM16-19 TaxID=2292042 RepID=UPI000E520013|nr:transketolase C-terminal domain-containing protein [Eggerthella sp. AM16-19]RHO39088.1 pyruvate ferredoxin oxidoreductase [Eggerthella sp. AM16-19]
MKRFLSGDEAFAEGVRLARPQVISAYPITPQTVVVERLSEMVEEGQLAAEYVHVESEHSALSCAIGASATGARTFTATSSQGLLYMAECLTYAAGGRFPIVMMNANRATALPWNIYGDQRDSLALLDHGWVQAYAQDNQEALDLALMAYAVAGDPEVRTPFMVNLDGFALTHTYESVDIPSQEQADAFLPPYDGAGNRFDFANPVNIGYSAGPEFNRYFKHSAHKGMLSAADAVERAEARFAEVFGRSYPGPIEAVDCDDADIVLITLGSIAGLARERVAQLRAQGVKAGLVRIRYMRPFPAQQIAAALANAAAVGVLEKDVSFGAEGTVMTNVCSALQQAGNAVPVVNFVGGLGGDDISQAQMRGMFEVLFQIAAGRIAPEDCPRVGFLGVDSVADEFGNPCCEDCGDAVAGGAPESVRDGACATDAEGGR